MKRVGVAVVIALGIGGAVTWWRLQIGATAVRLTASRAARLNGQFDAAEKELGGLPPELQVQIERAELRLARGDLPGAFGLLKAEAMQSPGDAHFWARYGFAAAVIGETEVAKMALTRASLSTPAEPEAATHLVQLLMREDPIQAAAKIKALELQAREPSVKAVFNAAAP